MDSLYCRRSFWLEDKKMRTHPEIVKDIESVLKDKVLPAVAAHNGEIKFISFHRGVVRLLLSGSCSGCAM